MKTIPILLKDGYKVGHIFQYPEGTTLVYSNLTPRKSRDAESEGIIFFGLQYFIKEYLQNQFRGAQLGILGRENPVGFLQMKYK